MDPVRPVLTLAWSDIERLHHRVATALEQELVRGHGVGLSAYRVLSCLARSPDDGMQLSALAAGAMLSPSRVSRIVHELEQAGHMERRTSPADGRAVSAALTRSGRDFFVRLHRTYLRTLQRELDPTAVAA